MRQEEILDRLSDLSVSLQNGETMIQDVVQPQKSEKPKKLVRNINASETFALMLFIEAYMLPLLGIEGGSLVCIEPTALETNAEYIGLLARMYPAINFFLYDSGSVNIGIDQEEVRIVALENHLFTKFRSNIYYCKRPFSSRDAIFWSRRKHWLFDRRNAFIINDETSVKVRLESQITTYGVMKPQKAMFYLKPSSSDAVMQMKHFRFLTGRSIWSLFDGLDCSMRIIPDEGRVDTYSVDEYNFNVYKRLLEYDQGSEIYDHSQKKQEKAPKKQKKVVKELESGFTKPLDSDSLFRDTRDTWIAHAIFELYAIRTKLLTNGWKGLYLWKNKNAAIFSI